VIECLNGYRSKERLPVQPRRLHRAHRQVEVVREGTRPHAGELRQHLQPLREGLPRRSRDLGISVELIDARTLLPFDRAHRIVESLKKTNRLLGGG
jgi:pyruvate/2-oxoglutarate/acetoin dehydrogenase E1 component